MVCGSPAAVVPGTVYLVGAGPGSVGLLTIRAVEVLAQCDVVLRDRLVPEEILHLARPGAEVRYVGKDAVATTEQMKAQQDDISSQMVVLAQLGRAVCRLKGGDPMIFGRGGEEMETLAAAGVPFEVVPAVTAALAAAADARIPLTYRRESTSLRIATVNPAMLRDDRVNWTQMVCEDGTHALYMGMSTLQAVCDRLLEAGVPAARSMALVDRASLPGMQVVEGTVGTLPALVNARADLQGPALVLLGEVVRLRGKMQCIPTAANHVSGQDAEQKPQQSSSIGPAGCGSASASAGRTIEALLPVLTDNDLYALRGRLDALLAQRAAAVCVAAGTQELC